MFDVRPAVGRFDDFQTVLGISNREVGACWCMSYRDARLKSPERAQYMQDLCDREPGPGVLLYVDDVPAGWCSVAPREQYRRLLHSRTIPVLDDPPRDDERDWVAVCFVVRAGYRKRGLMHRLLAGAVEHAKSQGARLVEGYPVVTGGDRVDVISGYVGTVELFEGAGFAFAAPTTAHSGGRDRVIMRRYLGSAR